MVVVDVDDLSTLIDCDWSRFMHAVAWLFVPPVVDRVRARFLGSARVNFLEAEQLLSLLLAADEGKAAMVWFKFVLDLRNVLLDREFLSPISWPPLVWLALLMELLSRLALTPKAWLLAVSVIGGAVWPAFGCWGKLTRLDLKP